MRLADLRFADLTVPEDPAQSRAKNRDGGLELGLLPPELWGELQDLYRALSAHDSARFRFRWNDLMLRVQRRGTEAGTVFVVRRIDKQVRSLDDIKFASSVKRRLVDPAMRSGLVLFCGPPGSGKTTLACSMLIARLHEIGGFTWTAENPVEYDMQGTHGKGQIYQSGMEEDSDVLRVFSDTLRSGADTFYIGEIREKSAATAAVLASSSGMLVVATIHADSPQQALLKMGLLSGWLELAQSLRAVIALRLEHLPTPGEPDRTRLHLAPLFLDPRSATDEGIRAKIREGNLAMLATDVEQQRNRLMPSTIERA